MRTAPLLLSLLAVPAFAQDDGETVERPSFSLDSVFMAPFHADDPAFQADASRLSAAILTELGKEKLVLDVDDVDPFEDYDAATYLEACPPGRYLGCVFVLADRGDAEWGIGGEVQAGESGPEVTVSYVDTNRARVVFAFTVALDGADDAAFVGGVGQTLDWLIGGAAESDDLRGEIADARDAWESGKLDNEDAARALVGLQEELGAMLDLDRVELRPPKLTASDLAKYREDDARNPWEAVGMTEHQYLRYRNSGLHLEAWRAFALGRARSVMLRAGGGFGAGPYDHGYDVRYVLGLTDGVYSEIEVSTLQELRNGSGAVGLLELGVGILPWLEVDGTLKVRTGTYSYFQHQEVEGDNNTLLKDPTEVPIATMQFGGRVVVAPLPTYVARPTLGAGLSLWRGVPVESQWGIPEFAPALGTPSLVAFEVSPGAEVSPGGPLILFARADISLAFGKRTWNAHEGQELLENVVTPLGSTPLGVDFVVGVALKLGPIGGVPEVRTEEEWEP